MYPKKNTLSKLCTLLILVIVAFGLSACEDQEGNRMYDTAIDYWKKGNYDEALQNLIALTKSYPNHSLVDDALFITAGIYQYYLDEPKNAIRFYRILNKNFQQSEYYVDSMSNLAEIYEAGDEADNEKAISIYKSLRRQAADERQEIPLYKLARVYMNLENYPTARSYLKQLIISYPESTYVPQAYLLIGFTYYNEGMIKLAQLTFEEVSKKYKDSDKALDSLIALANIYEELNQLENAIRTYTLAREKISEQDSLHGVLSSRISLLRERLRKIKR